MTTQDDRKRKRKKNGKEEVASAWLLPKQIELEKEHAVKIVWKINQEERKRSLRKRIKSPVVTLPLGDEERKEKKGYDEKKKKRKGKMLMRVSPEKVGWWLELYRQRIYLNARHGTGKCWVLNKVVHAHFSIYFADASNGEKIEGGTIVEDRQHNFYNLKTDEDGKQAKGRPEFWDSVAMDIKEEVTKKALQPDDSLVMVAEVRFKPPFPLRADEWRRQSGTNYADLYGDDATTDCKIKIANFTLNVHRAPLIVYSDYLRAYFGDTIVPVVTPDIVTLVGSRSMLGALRHLIFYCYHGYLLYETMEGRFGRYLFQLADELLMAQLKERMIQQFLCTTRPGNVVRRVKMADTHAAPILLKRCVSIISKHRAVITRGRKWRELQERKPNLAAKVLELDEPNLIVPAEAKLLKTAEEKLHEPAEVKMEE